MAPPPRVDIPTGEVCTPGETCCGGAACLSRCCTASMEDAHCGVCGSDGWCAVCTAGFEWLEGIECVEEEEPRAG